VRRPAAGLIAARKPMGRVPASGPERRGEHRWRLRTEASVLALSPEEQAKRFILPPAYRMELVVSEPNAINPAAMAFDGHGRPYVAENRSYMLDADAGRQHEPTSRIIMHESLRRTLGKRGG
jgi:hypothetical protein